MKTIINENQRGLKFKNGRFVGVLAPGKHVTHGNTVIEKLDIETAVSSSLCPLHALLEAKEFADAVVTVEVMDKQLAFHFVDGKFKEALRTGKYAFWKVAGTHTFTFADTSVPDVAEDFPAYLFGKILPSYYVKVEVAEYQKARIYFGKKLVQILDAGTYYFWRNDITVSVGLVDTRRIQLNIAGQEMLTRDKVTLRINFVCNYKIRDLVKVITEIDDYEEQLRVAAQLALRDYVGKYTLDEILENKQAISEVVFAKLKEKEEELFLTVYGADVKDIILPGEIRDIMNTVLIAEKRAQANVITRREEVASTRSLCNTAKLMEENPTLCRLKEMEYIERICENVGNITLNGSGDLISQLAGVLRGTGTGAERPKASS